MEAGEECTFTSEERGGRKGTGLTRTIAKLSAGRVLDTHNGKVRYAALRLIHLFSSLWRNVFRALLEEGFEETKSDGLDWDARVPGEGRAVNWFKERRARLRAAGVAHINDPEDMSNAGVCTASE